MSKRDQLRMVANAAEQDADALISLYEEILKANLLKGLQQSQDRVVALVTGQAVSESQSVVNVMASWVEQSESKIVEANYVKLPKLRKPKLISRAFKESNLLPGKVNHG